MIDYPALLKELRAEEEGLQQQLVRTQGLIVAIELRIEQAPVNGNGKAKAAKAPPKTKAGTPSASKGGRPRGVDEDVLTRARQQYEAGLKVANIAKGLKVTDQSVYNWASRGKWKRPSGQGVAAKPAAKPPAGEKLAGRVRCQSCDQMTEYDPCESCHQPLKKAWR